MRLFNGRRQWRQVFICGIIGFFLIGAASPVLPQAARWAASTGPNLSVNGAIGRHAISPDIYGITFWYGGNTAAEVAFAKAIHLPLNRLGGDATTRYNWKVDSSNAGQDWYFVAGNGGASALGASNDTLIADNRSVGATTVLTIPIINYINASSAWHCSFPQSKYGAQQSYDPYLSPNNDKCGNGILPNNSQIATETNPLDTDIPNDPSIQAQWVQHLVGKFGNAAHGGVQIYEMDNEPSGWLYMHRDVHPQGVGYTELRDRTYAYAAAVKAADPTALVLGPGDIAPAAYNCNNCGNDGASAHGNLTFGQWYLQQMAAYQQQHGTRILDYYSMHYPDCCGSKLVNVIHTYQGWINAEYPGTKLGFDEYNWGSAQPFASALTTADGLGIFGQQGVDLASYWGLDDVTWPTAYAFRMYRDYDGNGSAFGDVAVQASSDNPDQLAVYAAQRSNDGALTLLVVNKTGGALTSTLALAGVTTGGSAQVYQYSSANQSAIVRQPDQPVSAGGFSTTFPGNSLTMIAIPTATKTATATATPSATTTPTGTPVVASTGTPGTLAVAAGGDNSVPHARSGGSGSSGGGSPWLLWALLLIVLGVAGGFGFVWWRRRSRVVLAPGFMAVTDVPGEWDDTASAATWNAAPMQEDQWHGGDTFTSAWENLRPPPRDADGGAWSAPSEWDEPPPTHGPRRF